MKETARLRRTKSIAIDAAVFAILKRIDPDIMMHDIHKRGSIEAVEGSGEYTIKFDGDSIIRVSELEINSFNLEIL